MHVTYRYHCEGPHTLYFNHRHALLFLSLSLSIIKNAPQIQQPDTAYDFSNIQKTGIYVKSLFINKLQIKFHQNRTRNKEVIAILVLNPISGRGVVFIHPSGFFGDISETAGATKLKFSDTFPKTKLGIFPDNFKSITLPGGGSRASNCHSN